MLRDGRRVKLVQGLAEKAHVLWLERSFENRMQIADLPVTGELQKESGRWVTFGTPRHVAAGQLAKAT